MKSQIENPKSEIAPEALAFAEQVTTAALADATDDFNSMWAAGHSMLRAGGTMELDRNIFVRGAAYGVAWAAKHLVFGPNGDVELDVDIAPLLDAEVSRKQPVSQEQVFAE